MGDILTMGEIREKCPSEWVLIGDPETTPTLQVVRGRLLWHGADEDELHREARRLKSTHSAVFYTGAVYEEGAVYVL